MMYACETYVFLQIIDMMFACEPYVFLQIIDVMFACEPSALDSCTLSVAVIFEPKIGPPSTGQKPGTIHARVHTPVIYNNKENQYEQWYIIRENQMIVWCVGAYSTSLGPGSATRDRFFMPWF